ncbi:MAG: hypothetical protein AB8B60_05065 [Sulfitobacter sp.]
MTLAERTFEPAAVSTPENMTTLNAAIIDINNDELLATLQRAGRGKDFGNLRNFLTQIKLITQARSQSGFTLTPAMRADLVLARSVLEASCFDAAGNPLPRPEGDMAGGEENNQPKLSITTWLERSGVLTQAQRDILERQFNFRLLGQLLIFALSAIILAVAAHYGLIFARILRRGRRICKIPATLTCLLVKVKGHVTILGQQGCRFEATVPADLIQLKGTSEGTYCLLDLPERTCSAKLITRVSEDFRMKFETPLARAETGQLCDHSITPAKFDFTPVQKRASRESAFGLGDLPSA